ncbi:MAG: winged helix-turn-helix transcriptional regulator, partial [Holdemanella sp.]|nr:winged helix-turn-helix transcriptional regulator [Holdemanella sp.]
MEKEHIIDIIHEADIRMMKYLRKQKSPVEGIRYKDINVLNYIYKASQDHKTTISDLSNYLNVTTAAASQSVSAYEKQGWVKRVRSNEDRRVVYVQLTDQILIPFENKMKEYNVVIGKFIDYLDQEEAQQLCKIIGKTITFFEELENE